MTSRLFEELRRERAAGSTTTLRDWLHGRVAPAKFRQTLAGVAHRALSGEPFLDAVWEFLDEFALRPAGLRERALEDAPPPTGDPRFDAFLGGLAEHLALAHGLRPPSWTADPSRFAERFWFVSPVEGFRAIQIARSPSAFRRRGIFIHPDALTRC
jgi:hypothetical protein